MTRIATEKKQLLKVMPQEALIIGDITITMNEAVKCTKQFLLKTNPKVYIQTGEEKINRVVYEFVERTFTILNNLQIQNNLELMNRGISEETNNIKEIYKFIMEATKKVGLDVSKVLKNGNIQESKNNLVEGIQAESDNIYTLFKFLEENQQLFIHSNLPTKNIRNNHVTTHVGKLIEEKEKKRIVIKALTIVVTALITSFICWLLHCYSINDASVSNLH